MNDDGSSQRRLTNNESNDTHPKFSPNGEQIAFLSDRNGPYEIFIMNSDGSDVRQITRSIPSVHFPSFSADGSKLIFNSIQKGKRVLMIMELTDRNTSRYLKNRFNVYHPAWSPAGDKIAFDVIEGNNQDIYVANTDGSGFMRLTENAKGDFFPAWSPDGKHIAYIGGRNRNLDISVMKADGSGKKYLTSHEALDEFPSWGPDGKHIAFESRRTGKKQIFIISSDGTGLRQITFGDYNNSSPDWCKMPYSERKKTSENQKIESFPVLRGPYLGQTPPGLTPEVFAPNILNTEKMGAFCSVFSPDGDEFHFAYYERKNDNSIGLAWMRRLSDVWTEPALLPFNSTETDGDMCMSSDGNTLIFRSWRALPNGKKPKDHSFLWFVERTEDGWSQAKSLYCDNAPIRTGYPSIADNGTLYFAHKHEEIHGIYRSKPINGVYGTPEHVFTAVDSIETEGDMFVSPDESYMIISCWDHPENVGSGQGDLYITFQRNNGIWTEEINMGELINTRFGENCPQVTPDGKYFFFNRFDPETEKGNIYWVDAGIISKLKPEELR